MNPTQSQPMPEPQGILSDVSCQCPMWEKGDKKCGNAAKHPDGYRQRCTLPKGHTGDHVACYGGSHLTWPVATRTPAPEAVVNPSEAEMLTAERLQFNSAPEAVAGEPCKTCKGFGLIPFTRGQTPESFEQGEYDCPDCAPTPPVEADKDAEIARLWDIAAHLGRNDLHESADFLRNLATRLPLAYADLTTARATIAEREKRIETLVGALKKLLKLGKNCEGDIGWRGNPDAVVDYIRVKHILLIEAALTHAAEGKEQA